jgi:protein ATS1
VELIVAPGKRAAARSSPPKTIALPLEDGGHVLDLALGAAHSLALLSSGRVLAWGADTKGQIGGLDAITTANGIGATWGGSYLLLASAVHLDKPGLELWSQGSNSHSQLLQPGDTVGGKVELPQAGPVGPGTQSGVAQLVCGSEHVVLRLQDGSVLAGGWNEHGNLGLGDETDRSALEEVALPRGGRALGVWAGCAATWIWADVEGAP